MSVREEAEHDEAGSNGGFANVSGNDTDHCPDDHGGQNGKPDWPVYLVDWYLADVSRIERHQREGGGQYRMHGNYLPPPAAGLTLAQSANVANRYHLLVSSRITLCRAWLRRDSC